MSTMFPGEADAFLRQNDTALDGLTDEDRATIADHAEHHAGGLVVVLGYLPDDLRLVKVHDTWGDPDDSGPVIVHTYDPDADEPENDPGETVEDYPTMHAALVRFRELVNA